MSMIEGVLSGMAMRTQQRKDYDDGEAVRKKRAEDDEDRKFTMSERARALQMRADMGRAAATVEPVEVKQDRPDTMDNRDVGQAGEAPLPTAGYDVGGKRMADLVAAKAAATEQNTPQAVTARMSDVLMRNGDPVNAQKLRTGAMQERTAGLTLSGAERTEDQAKYLDDLHQTVPFGNWGAAAAFMNRSGANPQQGRFVVSPDGKKQVLEVQKEDGTFEKKGEFDNTPEGFMELGMRLERAPLETVQRHLHSKATLAQQAARDAESGRHNLSMEGIAKDKTAAGIEIATIRAEAAEARRAAGNNAGVAPVWDDKADAFLRERYTSKSPENGAVTVDGKGLQFGKLVALAEAQRNGGDTTTALGAAFQRDALLRAKATNAKGEYDPAKHDKLRDEALARMYAAPGKEPAAKEESPKTDASSKTVTTMADRVSEQTDGPEADKRWVLNKLMGPLDGDNKLADIAKNNANPKFRAAAAALLQERKQRAANVGDDIQPQAL